MALDDRLAELNRRAGLGDTRTLDALDQVGGWLGVGAAMLANALNPAASSSAATSPRSATTCGPRSRRSSGRRARARTPAAAASSSRRSASPPPSAAAPLDALDAVFADPTVVRAAPRPSSEEPDDRRPTGRCCR